MAFNYYLIKRIYHKCCFIDDDGLFNGISYSPFELDGKAYITLYVKPKHSHSLIMIEGELTETDNVQKVTKVEAQKFIDSHNHNHYSKKEDEVVLVVNRPIKIDDYEKHWDKPDKYNRTIKQRALKSAHTEDFHRREADKMLESNLVTFLVDKVEKGFKDGSL